MKRFFRELFSHEQGEINQTPSQPIYSYQVQPHEFHPREQQSQVLQPHGYTSQRMFMKGPSNAGPQNNVAG